MKTKEDKIIRMKLASLRANKCKYDEHKGRWILVGGYDMSDILYRYEFERYYLSCYKIIYEEQIKTNLGIIKYYVLDAYDNYRLIEEFNFDELGEYRARCLFIHKNISQVFSFLSYYINNIKNINLKYKDKEILLDNEL